MANAFWRRLLVSAQRTAAKGSIMLVVVTLMLFLGVLLIIAGFQGKTPGQLIREWSVTKGVSSGSY